MPAHTQQNIKGGGILLLLLCTNHLCAQLSLDNCIDEALKKSCPQLIAQKKKEQALLIFKGITLTNKPSVTLNGNIPAYNKDNYAVTQPDGSIKFLPRSQNYSNAGIGFSQPIGSTGGSLSINTDLYRFDNFTDKTTQYNGTPFFVRLQQPLFAFNAWEWDKKIAPITLQTASKELQLQAHQTAYEVCSYYFDVLDAQVNEELAQSSYANATTNLAIEKRKTQLGTSTADKVMQIEMQQLNSTAAILTAQQNKQAALLLLRNYINSTDTGMQTIQWPVIKNLTLPDTAKAIQTAKENLPVYSLQQEQQLMANKKTAEAKKQGRQVDIVASYGFNNAAANLGGIYSNPQNQQRFTIGINIPVADWGRRKNKLSIASAEQEQLVLTQANDAAAIASTIKNIVMLLPVLQQQISLSLTIDTLAAKRFDVANRLFQSGKLSLLELQAAQTEKENARRNYLAALRKFFETGYLLNLKTNHSFF